MREQALKRLRGTSFAFSRSHFTPRALPAACGLAALAGLLAASVFGQVRPPNDNFANATHLVGTNLTVQGNNNNATKEPGEPNHAGEPGGKSVWWSWQAPETGYVTISTLGSISSLYSGPLDTLLAVYRGSTVSNLTEVAANDDGPVDLTSLVSFRATGGTVYRIAVDGYSPDTAADADSGSIVLALKFSTSLPQAPAWTLPSIDGTMLSSTNFAGQVVLLNFWATWCGPCMAEIPDLIQLQNDYAADGLTVVGISVDNSPDGINAPINLVSSVAAANGMDYPIAMSRPHGIGVETAYGGIEYIPNTFVIDRHNQIVQTFVGSQDYGTFQQAVLPLLYADLKLNLTSANGVVHLSWPLTQASFVVESTSNPWTGPWSAINASVQSDGVNQWIELTPGAANQFFRLRNQ